MNILVVEDEALVALLVQEVVEEAGHACVGPAASVGEACALIDSCDVDAALLDIWLRDNEFVYPAARKLASRGVPFAFVSARAADGIDPAFADRPLIPKPMDERRVKGWLEEVVGIRERGTLGNDRGLQTEPNQVPRGGSLLAMGARPARVIS